MVAWDSYFFYDVTSPSHLRWRYNVRTKDGRLTTTKAGDVAGTLDRKGRWCVTVSTDEDKKRRYCHRIIYEMFNGEIPAGLEIDHIDGDCANNRPGNLRAVTRKVNSRNAKLSVRNVTGFGGVANIFSNGYEYYVSTHVGTTGKRTNKHFSVFKMGREQALAAAIAYREDAVMQLNTEGAGYTPRHGT